ncbi:ESCRT II complex subunit Dot2 [Dispira parvispora]|uniref:Vacuolar-sorting protein SNF8 n=1 Tax=Dispira parvispora TaxID=1520584 RepID=A0A9W8AX18_9FUNG|nr:ESCRT II complex subunit Dot2 [Dispira parvispora]
MSRRRVGLARIHYETSSKERFERAGESLAAAETEQLQQQLQVFKTNLEEFARKHQKKIRNHPAFRTQFQTMCRQLGVDPLASNKGFWADLLGFGDFYYELGIQIVDVCLSTRHTNGGLLSLDDVKTRVEAMRGQHAQAINEDDIVQAIKNLAPLGSGYDIITIGNLKMLRSVPREFNTDQSRILVLAQSTGFVTERMVVEETSWSLERVTTTLDMLLRDGLSWIDEQAPDGPRYWFPTYFFSTHSLIN